MFVVVNFLVDVTYHYIQSANPTGGLRAMSGEQNSFTDGLASRYRSFVESLRLAEFTQTKQTSIVCSPPVY